MCAEKILFADISVNYVTSTNFFCSMGIQNRSQISVW